MSDYRPPHNGNNFVELQKSGEDFIQRFCHSFAVNEQTALEMQKFYEEEMDAGQDSKDSRHFILLEMVLRELFKCQSVNVPVFSMCYTLNNPLLDSVIGGLNPTEYARKVSNDGQKMTKQNVTKLVKQFQASLNLPPRAGQRNETSCEKMSKSRIGQLAGK